MPDEFIGDLETIDDDGTILITVAPSTAQFFVTWRSSVLPFGIKDTAASSAVIESLLPRPPGPDSVNEQVTVRNRGHITLFMAGWVPRDETGRIWKLDSLVSLNPGEAKPVQTKGMAMNLKDNGDTVSLIAPDGSKKDEFHYSGSQEAARASG